VKKDIHPKLHLIKVTDSDGKAIELLSTKPGNLTINSARSTHSAWTKIQAVVKNNEKADKLKKFFF
jgi:ribosomal protein L31